MGLSGQDLFRIVFDPERRWNLSHFKSKKPKCSLKTIASNPSDIHQTATVGCDTCQRCSHSLTVHLWTFVTWQHGVHHLSSSNSTEWILLYCNPYAVWRVWVILINKTELLLTLSVILSLKVYSRCQQVH